MTLTLGHWLAACERLAPLRLAEDWDHVGLLVEGTPSPTTTIGDALVTIDLGEPVLEEALALGAGLVIAYHPPIFGDLERVTRAGAPGRVVIEAIRAGISVYSPHTALDAAAGGLGDWLVAAAGTGRVAPIRADALDPGVGAGRVITLDEPASLEVIVTRVKARLGVAHVRVAAAAGHAAGTPVRAVAAVPGAGGKLFAGLEAPDLYLTGEMRHHDIVARVTRGHSVIVCDHTHTERGFLAEYAARLGALMGSVARVHRSQRDREPLVVT